MAASSAFVSSVISTILYLGSMSPLLYCMVPSVMSSRGRIIVPETGELVSSSNFSLRVALLRVGLPEEVVALLVFGAESVTWMGFAGVASISGPEASIFDILAGCW